ncbi:hypothetical protein BO443_40033 [Burkholderia orbicola]
MHEQPDADARGGHEARARAAGQRARHHEDHVLAGRQNDQKGGGHERQPGDVRHREAPEGGRGGRESRVFEGPGSRQIIGNFPWRLDANPAIFEVRFGVILQHQLHL